jgi:SAM-dependent methyltransferase
MQDDGNIHLTDTQLADFPPAIIPVSPNWSSRSFQAQLSIAQSLRWMVDDFQIADGNLVMRGWFLSPFGDPKNARFLIDDQFLVEPDMFYSATGDVQGIVPDLPDCAYRFTFSARHAPDLDFHSVRFLPSGSLADISAYDSSWFLLDPAKETDPLPNGSNIYRVIATEETFSYRLGGATVANRMNDYLLRTQGKSVANIGPVLDWGSGCARVSRYLRKLGCMDLTGVDVDQTNVDWCEANTPWLSAQTVPLTPPTPFADNSFSLIIGISIFTHLRRESQFQWLDELHRLLQPGGIAIVSVMREGQIALQGGTSSTIELVSKQGFLMIDDNNQLHLGDNDENYYVNVYHSAEYLFAEWQRHLEVIDIVPFLAAHQDAVVLRKRA